MGWTFAGKSFSGRRTSFLLFGLLLISVVPQPLNAQTPSPSTGIQGVVSIGPIHGGPEREGVSNSAPLADTVFVVENATGVVTNFRTDDQGRFRVPLPPGHYSIKTTGLKTMSRRCELPDVEVKTTGFTDVQLTCDTGMR